MTLCLTMILSVMMALSATQAVSASSYDIRVSLAEQGRQIRVTSSTPVSIVFPSGQQLKGEMPLVLVPHGTHLMINGRPVKWNRVIISRRDGSLTVTISDERSGENVWQVGGRVIVSNHQGTLTLINEIDLEEYVAGVVASEVNPDWHPEVLKVQAVAARTYALYKVLENNGGDFDVVADVQDQVYHGTSRLNRAVRQAVQRTEGVIVTYDHAPIFAAYSSTVAGRTEDASNVWAIDLPYLKGVDCPFDRNSPRYRWRANLPMDAVERKLRGEGLTVGTIATLAPYSYSAAGRVNQLRILHAGGVLVIGSQDFRRIMGYGKIMSTQFEIRSLGKELVLEGKGSGHAVGLCQWGAKEMAELGYPYQAILSYFYPGTELVHRRSLPRFASID